LTSYLSNQLAARLEEIYAVWSARMTAHHNRTARALLEWNHNRPVNQVDEAKWERELFRELPKDKDHDGERVTSEDGKHFGFVYDPATLFRDFDRSRGEDNG